MEAYFRTPIKRTASATITLNRWKITVVGVRYGSSCITSMFLSTMPANCDKIHSNQAKNGG